MVGGLDNFLVVDQSGQARGCCDQAPRHLKPSKRNTLLSVPMKILRRVHQMKNGRESWQGAALQMKIDWRVRFPDRPTNDQPLLNDLTNTYY